MQEGLQARLRHPVMTDMATMTWVPYKPVLGPAINKIYSDFYGIDFIRPSPEGQAWFEVWPAKTTTEWRALSKEYNLSYVLAPQFMTLPLTPVVRGNQNILYEIK
jgi:hypothetical protein